MVVIIRDGHDGGGLVQGARRSGDSPVGVSNTHTNVGASLAHLQLPKGGVKRDSGFLAGGAADQ